MIPLGTDLCKPISSKLISHSIEIVLLKLYQNKNVPTKVCANKPRYMDNELYNNRVVYSFSNAYANSTKYLIHPSKTTGLFEQVFNVCINIPTRSLNKRNKTS